MLVSVQNRYNLTDRAPDDVLDYCQLRGIALIAWLPVARTATAHVASFNGKAVKQTWLSWGTIAHGGTLAHTLGTAASSWGTVPGAEPPSVDRAGYDGRRHVDASLRPASAVVGTSDAAQTVNLALDVLGQAPDELPVSFATTAPEGWTVNASPDSPLVIESV